MNRIYLVDLDAGKVTASFAVPGQVENIAWSADGATVAVTCYRQGRRVFSPGLQIRAARQDYTRRPGKNRFRSFGPVPDGRQLVDRPHDVAECRLGRTPELRLHFSEFTATDTASRGELGLWWWCRGALDTPHRILPVQPEDGMTSEIAVHPGGRLLATTTDRGILLSDLVTCERLQLPPDGIRSLSAF